MAVFQRIPSEEIALGLIKQAQASKSFVVIDTETTGDDIRDGSGYIMGVSLAYKGPNQDTTAFYMPFNHPDSENNYDINRFRSSLQQLLDTKPIVFHNASFDIISLGTGRLNAENSNYYCTMLLAHLVDENSLDLWKFSLDSADKQLLGGNGKDKSEALKAVIKLVGWKGVSGPLMAAYAAKDAEIPMRLMEYLLPAIKAENLSPVWKHKKKMIATIRTMERRGIAIDTDLCQTLIDRGTEVMNDVVQQLGGLTPSKSTDLKKLLIDQLKLPVMYHQKTGQPTFDKTAMLAYEQLLEGSEDRTAQLVLTYRGWMKATTAYYLPYINRLSRIDHRLHPSYQLHGTHTGRLSCKEPNLQQIPKVSDKEWNGRLKQCFKPLPGFVLIEADYSQLELRLGTAYARDQSLLDIFEDGRDVFTEMSAELGMSRQDTKTLVYSIQYGGGIKRISEVFGVSKDRANEIRNNYFERYPGFAKQARAASQIVERTTKIKLWSGRYRHFSHPRDQSHKAFNSLIQGGAADIVERQMVKLHEQIDNEQECRMLLQVHDSVVFEVLESKVDLYKEQIKELMEDVENGMFNVKFAVAIKKWGEE